jgi:hypothetical protein
MAAADMTSQTRSAVHAVSASSERPRLILVSYFANARLGPRGDRTQEVLSSLERTWSIDVIAQPVARADATRLQVGRPFARRTLHLAHSSVLLDKFEPWSARRFLRWDPQGAGALLVGFPFSPLVYAARRLTEAGIRYVVDVGDPWALTAERPLIRGLALRRARRAETRLWRKASGAIVTTEHQAARLRAYFPGLPILVRPNGFPTVDFTPTDCRPRGAPSSRVRIAHFGNISSARLDVLPFLGALSRSGLWDRVELHVFGSDWTGSLIGFANVDVVFHELRPWPVIVRTAVEYDLAMVIGNRDPQQLPSKAVAYLQLPIPRLAVVESLDEDALAQYVADKEGWLTLRADDGAAASKVARHASRTWTADELAAPSSESWEEVADTIARFVSEALEPCVAADVVPVR